MSNQEPSADFDRVPAEESKTPMSSNPERLTRSNRRLISGRSVTLPQNLDIGEFVESVHGDGVKDVIDDDATLVRSTRGSAGTPSPPVDEAKDSTGERDNRREVMIPPYHDKKLSDAGESTSEETISANTQMFIAAEVDKAIERKQSLILSNEVETVRQSLQALGYPTPAEINQTAAIVEDVKREAEEAAEAFLSNREKIDKLRLDLAKKVSTEYVNEAIETAFASAIDNGMLHAMARDALDSALGDDSFLTKLSE